MSVEDCLLDIAIESRPIGPSHIGPRDFLGVRLDLVEASSERFRMKRLFPLILLGVFAAAQHLAAHGMGASGYAPASHPPTTSYNQTQNVATASAAAAKPTGPPHVSVTVAAEENGAASTSFPTKTPHVYGSFKTTNTTKGDKLHAVWVNSATKKQLYKTDLTGQEANFVGTVSINGPATGWPPGKYELDVYLGNKMLARAPFTMK